MIRAYVVELDGVDMGSLRPGESLVFDLAPGKHSVRMLIDWCSSPTILIDGDQSTELVCKPGSSAFTALFDVFARSDRYIKLERA